MIIWALAGLVVAAIIGLVAYMLRSARQRLDRVEQRLSEQRERIGRLSAEDARSLAMNLINDATKFAFRPAMPTMVRTDLPALLKQFFERFEQVSAVYGDMDISVTHIGASQYMPSMIKIGEDAEHAEVVVKPGAETIWVVDGTEGDKWDQDSHPTIYHYIAAVADTIYGTTLDNA